MHSAPVHRHRENCQVGMKFLLNPLGKAPINFAVQWKAWFSFKFQRKSGWKLCQRIEICSGTPARALQHIERGHVGKPPYAPYPRRLRSPRRRSDHRSLCCDGGSSPVTVVASGPHQVVPIHRSAHRPWRPIGRRSGARRRPCSDPSAHGCVTGVTPLAPTDLPRVYKPVLDPAARARTLPPSTAVRH
jgi:hypothetical protein